MTYIYTSGEWYLGPGSISGLNPPLMLKVRIFPNIFFNGFGDQSGDTAWGVSGFMAGTRGCRGMGKGEGLPQWSEHSGDSTGSIFIDRLFLGFQGVYFFS